MIIRSIVHIDEEKCDGCGQCVPSCEEGAIKIIAGKAKVVSDVYCDGLGACLGHCPQDAISIVQREAEEFDEEAVAKRLSELNAQSPPSPCATGCPGTAAVQLKTSNEASKSAVQHSNGRHQPSQLANWPVQLHLVPPHAPFLHRADLLLVADCVPFACADFHTHIIAGRPVVIGCPKLDDCQHYVAKLAAIIEQARIQSISVVHMEVPCCTGLVRTAEAAIRQAAVAIPLHDTVITTRGEIIQRDTEQPLAGTEGQADASTFQLPIL